MNNFVLKCITYPILKSKSMGKQWMPSFFKNIDTHVYDISIFNPCKQQYLNSKIVYNIPAIGLQCVFTQPWNLNKRNIQNADWPQL